MDGRVRIFAVARTAMVEFDLGGCESFPVAVVDAIRVRDPITIFGRKPDMERRPNRDESLSIHQRCEFCSTQPQLPKLFDSGWVALLRIPIPTSNVILKIIPPNLLPTNLMKKPPHWRISALRNAQTEPKTGSEPPGHWESCKWYRAARHERCIPPRTSFEDREAKTCVPC